MNTHVLVWGWLRLLLSVIQTSSSVAGILFLLFVGLVPTTWFLILIATIATLSSRLLYKGRPDPRLTTTTKVGQEKIQYKGGDKWKTDR